MRIKRLVVGTRVKANCYIIWNESQKECAVIDPGYDEAGICQFMEEECLQCRCILITHGHYDHTMAANKLSNRTKAPIYASPKDIDIPLGNRDYIFHPAGQTILLEEGLMLKLGGMDIKAIETPGHSPGGFTFLCQDCLFTGDTLMAGECGRTDFLGGDAGLMSQSLKKLCQLPGNYTIYPGHGAKTTMDIERTQNPYCQIAANNHPVVKGG